MSVSTDQYTQLLTRLTRLENTMNDVITALNQQVTVDQVSQVLTLLSTQISDLSTTVTSLEARVTTIEEEPLT